MDKTHLLPAQLLGVVMIINLVVLYRHRKKPRWGLFFVLALASSVLYWGLLVLTNIGLL